MTRVITFRSVSAIIAVSVFIITEIVIFDAAALWAVVSFFHLGKPVAICFGAVLIGVSLWAAMKVVQFAIDAETDPVNN